MNYLDCLSTAQTFITDILPNQKTQAQGQSYVNFPGSSSCQLQIETQ